MTRNRTSFEEKARAMLDRNCPANALVLNPANFGERHYSIKEIAEMWSLSPDSYEGSSTTSPASLLSAALSPGIHEDIGRFGSHNLYSNACTGACLDCRGAMLIPSGMSRIGAARAWRCCPKAMPKLWKPRFRSPPITNLSLRSQIGPRVSTFPG